MIEIEGLKKRYSRNFYALKGIDLNIDRRVTTIIGRNGAGKTTLIRILSTQLSPSEGSATIEGYDIMKDTRKVREIISSIPQEAQPIGILSPMEQVKLYLIAKGFSAQQASKAAREALEELDMDNFRNSPSDTLSGGMKRKVFVAMALASNSEVIFLDEPTTGLDPLSRMEVWSAVKRLKSKVILTTHYMEEAQELSDTVCVMDSGKVVSYGTIQELLKSYENMMRAEKMGGAVYDIMVGNIAIKYIGKNDVDKFLQMGYDIKNINLDDLFLSKGVSLES
ncbi:MAG: ABC transporter ATP-binding protein [Thermoplasmata archaeon]